MKTITLYITLIINIIAFNFSFAQNSFVQNISTGSHGAIPIDVVYANGQGENLIFTYTNTGVIAYNENDPEQEAIFVYNSNVNGFSQYQFPFNALEVIPVTKLIAYDNSGYVYIVLADFSIVKINTLNFESEVITQLNAGSENFLQSIIRYDNNNERLYFACKTTTGSRLSVYEKYGLGQLSLLFTQNFTNSVVYDVAYNTTNNIYYLSTTSKFEVWEIIGNIPYVRRIIQTSPLSDSNGKLIYVNDQGFHKIYCLPFGSPVTQPMIHIIDGNDYSQPVLTFNVTANKIRAASYFRFGSTRLLLVGYLIDDDWDPSDLYDIEVYDIGGTNSLYQSINTTFGLQNYPIVMNKHSNNVLVGKQDELIRLSFNGQIFDQTVIAVGENNYFFNSAFGLSGRFWVNKLVTSGISVFNADFSFNCYKFTGMPVYQSEYNPRTKRAYFYSTQNFDNQLLAILNTDNMVLSYLSFDYPIASVIVNKRNNDLIVVENSPNTTYLKIFDGFSHQLKEVVNTGVVYCEKLFIDENNNLLVIGNMLTGLVMPPTIRIFDARDYSFKAHKEMNFLPPQANIRIKSDVVYNTINESNYIILRIYDVSFDPSSPSQNSGAFYSLSKSYELSQLTIPAFSLDYPQKLVFADLSELHTESDYMGTVLIKLWGGNFRILNLFDESIDPVTPQPWATLVDVTYSPFHKKFYGVKAGTSFSPSKIYEVSPDGTVVELYSNINYETFCTIFYNPHSNLVNVFSVKKSSNNESELLSFKPHDFSFSFQTISLNNYSLDLVGDNAHFIKNIFVFDPINNKMFIPNGAHNNISVIDFVPEEILYLKPGWNWISFPRLEREDDDPVPSIPTVENRIFPVGYQYAELRHLPFTAPPEPDEDDELVMFYEYPDGWNDVQLPYVQSTEGYKIWVDPKDIEHHLLLRGNMLQPSTSRTLYAGKYNWTGYFLPETQNPIHAIGDNLNKLRSIQAADWFAWNAGTEAKPVWMSTPIKPLKYGDMLVLQAIHDIEDFQWDRQGNPFEDVLLQQPENYSYTELSGYTAMIIEYDTTEIPLEIGAFVGDSCVGACVIDPSDSLAYIRAYIPPMTDDTVTFECYYGLKSGRGTRINQYALMDDNSRMLSKRPILTRNKKSFYFVSLRNAGQQIDNEELMSEVGSNMKVYPNPSQLDFSIEYEMINDGQLTIELLSLQGSQLATIRSGWHSQGAYRFDTSWIGLLNGDVRSGMYLVRLTTNNTSIVQRVFKF